MKLEIVTNAPNEKMQKEIERIEKNCQVIYRGRNTLTVHLTVCPQMNENTLQECLEKREQENVAHEWKREFDLIVVCLNPDELIENDLVKIVQLLLENDFRFVVNSRIGASGYVFHDKRIHHALSFEFIGNYVEKFFPHSDRINVNGLFNENVEKIELK